MILRQPNQAKDSANKILQLLTEALSLMRQTKPNDRSEMDRYLAISVTDMEKLVSFFKEHVAMQTLFVVRGRDKQRLHLLGIKASYEEAEALRKKFAESYEFTYLEEWKIGEEVEDVE